MGKRVLNKEQDAYIKQLLQDFKFKDIDTSHFVDCCSGNNPLNLLFEFKFGLEDFAKILNIRKCDIGMNGCLNLSFNNKGFGNENWTGSYDHITKTINIFYLKEGAFAHEWGHAFDNIMGNYLRDFPHNMPPMKKANSYQVVIASKILFGGFFPEGYKNKCEQAAKLFGKMDLSFAGYVKKEDEMFARAVDAMVSNNFYDAKYDFSTLSNDHRDLYDPKKVVEIIDILSDKNRDLHDSNFAQRILVRGCFPLPNKYDQRLFETRFNECIEELKRVGFFGNCDFEINTESRCRQLNLAKESNTIMQNCITIVGETDLNRSQGSISDDMIDKKYLSLIDSYYTAPVNKSEEESFSLSFADFKSSIRKNPTTFMTHYKASKINKLGNLFKKHFN